MARLLLLCITLANFSPLLAEAYGSGDLGSTATMATKGRETPDHKAVFGLNDLAVSAPTPSPLSGAEDSGRRGVIVLEGNRRLTRHHSPGSSVAGGDVILGGFATALVAAIFCYIWVTGRTRHAKAECHGPTSPDAQMSDSFRP
ncbi:hypothetical protein NMG60_11022378 [Bertholletia excelsa]